MASEHSVKMALIRRRAAELLDERRPDRYVISDSTEEEIDESEPVGGIEWMDEVADEIAPMLPEDEVRKLLAARVVQGIETSQMRRGNDHVRRIFESEDQGELEVMGSLNYPVQVITRTLVAGSRPKIKMERVRIAALSPGDLMNFAAEERRRAAKDFATRNRTCEAAEWLASQVLQSRCSTVGAWAEARASRGAA